jgi:hypothetical protein
METFSQRSLKLQLTSFSSTLKIELERFFSYQFGVDYQGADLTVRSPQV